MATPGLPDADSWRNALAVGSQVDAMDGSNIWYYAKVVQANPVAVRICFDYHWPEYVILSRSSERLAPHTTRAMGRTKNLGVPNSICVDRQQRSAIATLEARVSALERELQSRVAHGAPAASGSGDAPPSPYAA
jgi:hypothetical protein